MKLSELGVTPSMPLLSRKQLVLCNWTAILYFCVLLLDILTALLIRKDVFKTTVFAPVLLIPLLSLACNHKGFTLLSRLILAVGPILYNLFGSMLYRMHLEVIPPLEVFQPSFSFMALVNR